MPSMSDQVEEDLEFRWGAKKGQRQDEKNVQFYRSFTYDGVKYSLFDSVYVFKDGETEPYVGKLIKIWENEAIGIRRVKLLWFFYPHEVSNYLGNEKVLENELFLACGEGKGLANINPLVRLFSAIFPSMLFGIDQIPLQQINSHLCTSTTFPSQIFGLFGACTHACVIHVSSCGFNIGLKVGADAPLALFVSTQESIAGKCNVVCISRDKRNRQPSEHELMVADYIFYRTFDVDKLIISDKLGEKISSEKVTDLLNKREPTSSILPNVDAVRIKNEPNSVSNIGKGPVVERTVPGGDKTTKDDFSLGSLMGNEEKKKHFTEVCDNGVDMSGTKNISSSSGLKQIEAVAVDKFRKDVMRPKTEAPSTFIRSSDAEDNGDVRMPVIMPDTNGVKFPEDPAIGIDRDQKSDVKKGSKRLNEATEDSGLLEVKRAKLLKSNGTTEQFVNLGGDSLQNSRAVSDFKDKKASVPSPAVGNKIKGKMVVENSRIDALPEKLKSKEQTNKVSGQKLQIAAANHLVRKSSITYGQLVEVTRRPEVDKRKWFTPPPWEDEVKNATERGSLVLLMNLDPASASSEVEDIIWHGCQESCTAKMIARTAISSPHSGQALAIFKTKDVADKVIGKLERGCLMLPSGRPLVACTATANVPAKRNSFPGHLFIDKIKFQMQKNGAVSTFHGAQTNTLEYDMAKEWLLHQERTTFCWKKLYKNSLGSTTWGGVEEAEGKTQANASPSSTAPTRTMTYFFAMIVIIYTQAHGFCVGTSTRRYAMTSEDYPDLSINFWDNTIAAVVSEEEQSSD
ncbi:ANTI-SILENCING 1-like protein [Drosera capensis]